MDKTKSVILSFVDQRIYTPDSYWCIVGLLTTPHTRNSMTSDASISSCVLNNIPLDHVIFGTFFGTNLTVEFICFFCFLYLRICVCLLCIVICMHSFHCAHICIDTIV